MRFDNSKSVGNARYACILLLLAILFFLFLLLEKRLNTAQFYKLCGLVLISIIYIFARADYFLYDSYGNILRFKYLKTMGRFYLRAKKRQLEFDKARLKQYKLNNYIVHKTLVLYIYSLKRKKRYKKITLNITFLSHKKTILLRKSLDKVVISNTATA